MKSCCVQFLALVVVCVAFGVAAFFSKYDKEIYQGMQMSNGYGAKVGCSIVFVAGRDLKSALEAEFIFPPIRLFSILEVQPEEKCVLARSRFFPQLTRTACWRSERLGCALLHNASNFTPVDPIEHHRNASALFPIGDAIDEIHANQVRSTIDMGALENALDEHFADERLHTRAVILIKDGQIVYERYGDGCNDTTPLLGWSMTKSLTNTLIGRRIQEGKIPGGLQAKLQDFIPEYRRDERGQIDLESVLRMTDGLDIDEYYSPGSLATRMLFINQQLLQDDIGMRISAHEDSCFRYSSHSTNVLSKFLRNTFKSHEDYLRYPTESIFNELGMDSAVLETDPAGTFIGSSFGWATARDWARFGMFLLQDGVWNGTRLLPEGWMDFSTAPTPTSGGVYGAHFWGHLGPAVGPGETKSRLNDCDKTYPSRTEPSRDWMRDAFPRGSYLAHGFEEQVVIIVPETNVVFVRLGQIKPLIVPWEPVAFYSSVLQAAGAVYK